uniref:E3 SUMO-protein ligase gei-17 n=1 Tax=Haemonchus contortus TaxID=6289 RepID=A0A7I4XTR6_HAECO
MDREQFPQSELRYVESMIASMRVNELQTVLSMFKMPKLGKKQELIQRCTDLLRSPSVQMQVANQVKLMIGKGTRVAPYAVPVRGYMSNGGMINGNNGAYGGYRSGQMMPPMQNSLHQQCRPLRNLVPIDLPFYDNHQTLLEPMELPAVISGVKSPCKQSYSFLVPRERFANWTPTSPLPRFEVQLRFFQVPAGYNSQELPDDFPLNCMVRLEEQIVQLPAVIPTNKPNVEPKRPSRPVDITQQCLNVRDASRPLRLLIEWTGDKRVWAVAVYLVYRVTSDILRDRAIGTYTGPTYGNKPPVDHHQNEHVTRDVIRTRLGGGNDDDIAMAQLKISLLCPLSRKRITLPARCKKCPHLQCFDLYNYLQMNEKRATWRCPVCSDWAPYKLLIIDAYFQDVLSNVDAGAVEVELLVDGSYRTVKSECIDVDSDDTDEKSCTNSGTASGSGTGATSSKPKTTCDDDIIVLSDSDDDEQQAVERAIRASMVDSSTTRSGNPPVSPTPRSRDSSIIILDDDSPPRPPPPAAPAPTNNVRQEMCLRSGKLKIAS